jgi:hypothetical protein
VAQQFKQRSDLLLAVQDVLDPDGTTQAPEFAAIAYAVNSLKLDVAYTMFDDQVDVMPACFEMLPEEVCSSWSGSAEKSLGYGGCAILRTQHGNGLRVWLGGSHLASATGFVILPSACVEILGL